ncbi:site-specific integrase [Blastopirellula sp. J2-11]|uniref:tyrosine-type recombinase/integrase n=1 Tax=Blastopirellula sp. J2-11 TaxID=2943192 RepID=UPI0021C9DA88|nr:site-specific integrase [Blastopirellula sp. J2-11]UUO04503.1 site-specific integrase [Blastopirellula sp. J2-11]
MRKTAEEDLYYNWRVFQRRRMYYADGRSNMPNLGRHSLGTRDLTEAKQQLQLLDRKLAVLNGLVAESAGETPFPAIPIEVGMRQYLDHCRRPRVMGGKAEGTIKRYGAVGDKFSSFCKQINISSWQGVTKSVVERYGGDLDRLDYAQRTISLELHLVQHVVHWFIDEKRLPQQQRMKLGLKKLTGSDTYCYTRAQVDAILAHCNSNRELDWLYVLLATLAMTGMRIGEAINLRHSDIEWEPRPFLKIADEGASQRKAKMKSARKTKGKRGRIVPIHDDLQPILKQIIRHRDGYVFHGPRGGRLKADTARVIFKRDVVEQLAEQFPTEEGDIGFVHARFHSFRHYFVSKCSEAGASDGQIKDWVGHKDSEMVALYRHQFDDTSQSRMKSIQFTSV